MLCVGYGGEGQLATGTTSSVTRGFASVSAAPVVFGVSDQVVTVTAGAKHMCALFTSFRAICWGQNTGGQLGQGLADVVLPVPPGSMTSLPYISFSDSSARVSAIACGASHTCFLFDAGGIICFGLGSSGETGLDLTTPVGMAASDMTSLAYISFSTSDPAESITAGPNHNCAIFRGGRVRCWGRGGGGRLGTGSISNVGSAFGQMSTLGFVVFSDGVPAAQVSAGYAHTCVAFDNGGVRCFGTGQNGALGYGSQADQNASDAPYISVLRLFTPGLEQVYPDGAPSSGGFVITLTGTMLFTNSTFVTIRWMSPGDCAGAPVNRSVAGVWTPLNSTSGTVTTPAWPCTGPATMAASLDGVTFGPNGTFSFIFYDPAARVTGFASADLTSTLPGSPVTLPLLGVGLVQLASALCRFRQVPAGVVLTSVFAVSSPTGSCVTPGSLPVGAFEVSVALNGANFTSASPAPDVIFRVLPVTVSGLDVGSGPSSGGTLVTVSLTAASGLDFFNLSRPVVFHIELSSAVLAATGTLSPDRRTATFATPAQIVVLAGVRARLTVSFNGGASYADAGAFLYYPDPAVVGLAPAALPAEGAANATITVTGTNFFAAQDSRVSITLRGAAGSVLFARGQQVGGSLTFTFPSSPGAAGLAIVEISMNGQQYTSDGRSISLFAVTSLSPRGGRAAGGTRITVTGSFFVGGLQCLFACPASNATLVPATTEAASSTVCTAPASPRGPGACTVEVGFDGRFSSAGNGFTYIRPAFLSLDPASVASVTVGLNLTLTGSGFTYLGVPVLCRLGTSVTAAEIVNATVLVCPAPSLGAGLSSPLGVSFNGVEFEDSLPFSVVPPTGGCAPGSERDARTGACSSCQAGSSSANGTTCSLCPKGRYASSPGMAECLPCEAGWVAAKDGSTACAPCAPGSFAARNESTVCVACPPGQVAGNWSSTACDVCPRGQVAESSGMVACRKCLPGSFSVEGLSTTCPDCPLGTYSDVFEARECKACPGGTFSGAFPRDSAQACVCKPGFFERNGARGVDCEVCPAGGACNGTDARPVPVRGYWASSRSPFAFIRCDPIDACPGGELERCAEGYRGRMCSQCMQGWFRAGGECKRCPKGAPGILFAFVLFSVLIVVLLVRFGGRRSAKAYGGTIGIATKFFQVLAVIGRLDVLWPSSVKSTIAALTTPFSLKFDTLGPECSAVSIRYEHKWGFTMLLPVFFAAIFAVVFIGAWVVSKIKKQPISASLKNRIVNGYLSLLSLGFLTLATTALEPFGCRLEKDDRWTLVADPSRLCFERWWKELVPFAAIGIVVYVVGIPLAVLWWLRRNRSNLSNPEFIERYGGLYSTYSQACYAWEPAVMAEKVAIAAIGLLLNGFVMLQVILLQGLFVITLSVYQSYTPYARGKDNRLHAVLRWCSLIVLFSANLFRADQFPSASLRRTAEVVSLLFISVAVLVIVLSMAYNLWQIRKTLKMANFSEPLERAMAALLNLPGRVAVTKWLSKDLSQAPVFEKLLNSITSPAEPPPPDPDSDLIVTVFTSGVLIDEAVPVVRSWVCERLSNPAELMPFIDTFTSISRLLKRQQTPPSTTNPLITTTPANPSSTATTLFTALFGFSPHTPSDALKQGYLAAAQGILLARSKDPGGGPGQMIEMQAI